ncbi:MAG: hypothetical protein P1V51_07650 [Deltaproteobacteria bacterium]|nr:hypothetical protein [Deltaproteobacteria bacterium]
MSGALRVGDLTVPCWLLDQDGALAGASPSARRLGSPFDRSEESWLGTRSAERLAALIDRIGESWRPLRFRGQSREGRGVTLLVQRLRRPALVFVSVLLHPEGDPDFARRDYRRVSVTLRSALHAPIQVAEALVAGLEDTAPGYPPARVLLENGVTAEHEYGSAMGAVLPILGAGERLLGFAELGGSLPGIARLERCALLCRFAATRLAQLAPADLALTLARGTVHGLSNQASALLALTDTLQNALERGRDPAAHLTHLKNTASRMSALLGDLRQLGLHLDRPVVTTHPAREILESAAAICQGCQSPGCAMHCVDGLQNDLGDLLFPAELAVQILSTGLRESPCSGQTCTVRVRVARPSPFAILFEIEAEEPLPEASRQTIQELADAHPFGVETSQRGGAQVYSLRFPALPLL